MLCTNVMYEVCKNRRIGSEFLLPLKPDGTFNHGKTAFLMPGYSTVVTDTRCPAGKVPNATYYYSDQLNCQHSSQEFEDAWEAAIASRFEQDSAAFFEIYLRVLVGRPDLKLVHLITGFVPHYHLFYHGYGCVFETTKPNLQ